jgi:hypothetical protein
VLRALSVAEGELQLFLRTIVARSAGLAEEFANLDQDIFLRRSA